MEKQYEKYLIGYSNSVSRWLRFGPYYAMFPMEFAFDVIEKYSNPNEYILDPFFGRGTSIVAACVLNRRSLGIEINPLGWLYTKTKLNPASPTQVLKRLEEIDLITKSYRKDLRYLPQYFRMCFCDDVLVFLLSARDNLNWRKSKIDGTLMSFILVYLHGKIGEGLSNQLRMTKSMGYNYSIEWWRKNGFENPPEINPVEFIKKRIYWRYDKGKPELNHNEIYLADSSKYLDKLIAKGNTSKYSLLFTSPPYWSITNYHTDQWLRMWLLGGEMEPKSLQDDHRGRFLSKQKYYELLDKVFSASAKLLKKKSVAYVRTDARAFTFETTKQLLIKHFPKHEQQIHLKPFSNKTQTQLFGDKSEKPGEVDIIMIRK